MQNLVIGTGPLEIFKGEEKLLQISDFEKI